jgi:16S rRNA (cytidine1402-2'-O)-methyltransferase
VQNIITAVAGHFAVTGETVNHQDSYDHEDNHEEHSLLHGACVKGTCYIVATPIGNLADITRRAIDILGAVDCIAAEDTRHARKLLTLLGLQRPLLSLHEHNEQQRSAQLCSRLQQGQSIALITDAGTPLISDPGYRLVSALRQSQIPVVPIPGACAAIAALSVSGLPTDRFYFEGFLPAKALARQQRLQILSTMTTTLVFYESIHRILPCLIQMVEIFGAERPALLCRELTKRYETYYGETLGAITRQVQASAIALKGELVLIVGGAPDRILTEALSVQEQHLLQLLKPHLSKKLCAQIAQRYFGESKQRYYDALLQADDGPISSN